MISDRARRIVEGAEIPSIPHVLQKILKVTGDPTSSSRDLEKLITTEPALVTHLLKTVNSANFGYAKKVNSISHTIVMLGVSTVKSIASGLMLIDVFNNLPGLNQGYVVEVWKCSLVRAGVARLLARGTSSEKQEELFLGAMVLDIGHLVLAQHHQQNYDALTEDDPFPSPATETESFEIDHADTGAALLETWQFSPAIIDLVATHHQADTFAGDQNDLNWLELADGIARQSGAVNEFLEMEEEDVHPDFLQRLTAAGWCWNDFRGQKDTINEAIKFAHEVVTPVAEL
ncbi:MAG: HDOD domain-containing protein [Gemmatimonadales bacterium]|nr:HDOD domain-containing protein [Gemmatimonadales bacterium]